jgi:hypothetical protein
MGDEQLLQNKKDDVRVWPLHFFESVERDKGIATRAIREALKSWAASASRVRTDVMPPAADTDPK